MTGAQAVLVLALAAHSLQPATASDCAAYGGSGAAVALEDLAGVAGEQYAIVTHVFCSADAERLDGLSPQRVEAGWCGELVQDIPVAAPAVRARIDVACHDAMRRGVTYLGWSAVVGDELLRVTSAGEQIAPLSAAATR